MDVSISKEILKCCGCNTSTSSNNSLKGNSLIITSLDSDSRFKHLLGGTNNQIYSEITSWLTFVGSLLSSSSSSSSSLKEKDLLKIDSILVNKSYLVGNSLTVADIAMFVCIRLSLSKDFFSKCGNIQHLARWFDHIQHLCCTNSNYDIISFSNNLISLFPISLKATSSPVTTQITQPSSKSNDKDIKTTNKNNNQSVEKPPSEKVDKDSSSKPPKVKPTDDAKKEVKKDDKQTEELDPSKLELKVGKIIKCTAHPDAEKLLVEEIDCGEEGGPRTICSGLKAFYKPEEMVGRTVLIVANLKDRTMVGVKSMGMVLCACK